MPDVPIEQMAKQQQRERRAKVIHGKITPTRWQGEPVPERGWIVPELIPRDAVTIVSGDGGVGKSLLSLQILTAAALGMSWLGKPVEKVKALGVFCEDTEGELHSRMAPIAHHYRAEFSDLTDLLLYSRVGMDSVLVNFEHDEPKPTALYGQLLDLATAEDYELIVLDSLHDLFAGNENSRVHARQFVNLLRTFATETGGAVILNAHPSVAGLSSGTGASGSTAWNNASRSRLYLTRPQDDDSGIRDNDARILRTMKANYAQAGGEIRMRWVDGVLVAENEDTGILGTIKRRSAEDVFLYCLDLANEQGRHLTDAHNSARYAPKVMATMSPARGYSKTDLTRAMARLFDDGRIRIGSAKGSNRHDRKAIIRTEAEAQNHE